MEAVDQSSISEQHRASKDNHIFEMTEAQPVASQQDLQDIWRWNATVPDATDVCAHERIMDVTKRQHNAPAVCAWDGDLTYGELDEISNALAHCLVELGVGPNSLVALCFEKSMWTPVAMLGAMKAGGASVAMDSTQPEQRLRTIVQQVKPAVVLSSRKNEDLAKRLSTRLVPVVVVDKQFSQTPHTTNHGLPKVSPHDLLYVVFTSGSTGIPKGAKISHRSCMSGIDHLQTPLQIHSESRVYDFASYAFDVPWGNLLLALCVGGCLCVPSQEDIYLDVAGSMNRMRATFAHLTPTVARSLDPASIPCLETIDLGGEPVLEIDKMQWMPHTTLVVTYGPAECTVSSMCEENPSAHMKTARIGRGAGVNTWVVSIDGTEELVPIGAVGELYLEGPLVGNGYLEGSEQIVAYAFDPPWLLRGTSEHPGRGGRLYRTGDLVHYNDDGGLTFIGRKDAQVKIRGQRVELSEVEYQVTRSLGITKGVAFEVQPVVIAEVLRPHQSSHKILAVFIRIEGIEAEIQMLEAFRSMITEVEEKLTKALPIYMVPNAYIPLFSSVPRTATGKVDRLGLRAIGESYTLEQMLSFCSREETQPPATDMERQLQQLWATTLGIPVETIGRSDSFLQLGGDSIGAMRLVGLARRSALSLTVQDIFDNPRLSNLASAAEGQTNIINSTEDSIVKPFSMLNMYGTEAELQQRVAAKCRISSEQVEDVFPCTSLQEGLFVLTIKHPGDYIARFMFELQPDVDLNRFKAAWEHTYATTPILRTRIVELLGDNLGDFSSSSLVQAVINERINWRETQGVDEYLETDKAEMFAFGTPLARFGLVHGDNHSRYFVWTMHHALYDGWSVPLFIKRVQQAYSGETLSRPPPFQAFVRHVVDIDKSSVKKFWQEYFNGLEAQPFPTLPSNTYQPRADQTTVHSIGLQWPKSDITPSTLIRAAWSMLVAQYSGTSDVIFGMTVFGRQVPVAHAEEIVGPMIATVPVRVNADPEQNVNSFLQKLQQEGTQRIPYDHTGVQYIRQASDSAEMACRFQTLLVVQPPNEGVTGHSNIFEHTEGKIKGIENPGDDYFAHKTYALQLLCNLEDDGVQVRFNYDSNVIDAAHLARMANQLDHLLGQLCSTLNGPRLLRQLQSITQQDISAIWEWNSPLPETVDACVHNIISKTAQRRPDAQAICAWDGTLSYYELDQLSNKLALHLLQLGDLRAPVPLVFEKSKWMAVAMLGVMKAGGASVAVDSAQPEERLRLIVHQVKPTVILSSLANQGLATRLVRHLAEPSKAVVVVDKTQFASLPSTDNQTLPNVSPQDLLYVVFTSGSTGTPKGAMVSHYNFSSAIKHQKSYLRCSETARVYDFPSYSFDVAWLTALHTLSAGGCLCVPSETDRKTNITASIQSLRANIAHIVPTVARIIDREVLSRLDLVVTGGEAMTTNDFLTWGNLPNVMQVYGPSECVPPVTLTGSSSALQSRYNVGKGVGVNTWLIDPLHGCNLSPIGAVGEVLVEGPLVGQGYYADTARTAASFIEDPVWLLRGTGNQDGRRGRLYKTGDLARYNSDGTLTILGRKDGQVKIRGQRVELGDIEYRVAQNLDRDVESLVIAEVFTPRESSTQILAAFINIFHAYQTTNEQMHDSVYKSVIGLDKKLSKVLPVYMVPNAYIPVLTMPMTATGKIDRRQIREMGESLTIEELTKFNSSQREREPPATDMERRLQQLWATTLGIKAGATISRDDSFLGLGGDSIAALRLVALARTNGLLVTMQDVFSQPRLRELALAVQEHNENTATEEDNDIEPFSLLHESDINVRETVADMTGVNAQLIEDVFPCTALQEGLFVLTIKRPGDYVARFALKLHSDINLKRLKEALEDLVATTPILRTRIVELPGEGLVQAVIDEINECHEHQNLGEYIEEDKQRNFGPGTPLARFALIDRGNEHNRYLVWTMHHALYDGWSMPLLLQRFEQAYAGKDLDMPPPFQSFVKHAIDMNRNEHSKQFWQDYFANINAQPFPTLPSSSYQPKADKSIVHHIAELQWPNANTTPSTLLRAAWSILAAQYTGTSDIVFGVTVFGRQAADVPYVEEMVGPTNATVPVRILLDPKTSLNVLLQQVQQQLIELMPFEQTGLQNIRHINHDTEQACHFQTVLVVQPVQQEGIAHSQVFQSLHAAEAILGSNTVANAFNTYALQLICSLEENGLQVNISYDSKVLSSATADRIPYQLEHILREICKPENGPRTLNEIEFASQHDISDVWHWNATVPEAADACCVHNLITKVARKYPDRQAVCAWDGNLTYRELDELSTKLAFHLLDAYGTSNGSLQAPIPLCFEKSMWMPIAMLGVMKAGGTSVALDSTQPEERLRTIIQQVKPTIILSSFANHNLATRLLDQSAAAVIVDETHLAKLGQAKEKLSLPQVDPSDWIYITFTSGSTGLPKGAIATHSNLAAAVQHQRNSLRIDATSRIYDFTSYAWDLAWVNFIHGLTAGGCLCVPSASDRTSDITGSINRLRANYAYLTPSIARILDPAMLRGLKIVNLIGEAISESDSTQWTPYVSLINTYGPSECSALCTYEDVHANSGVPRIGKGIGANTWIVTTDGREKLAAIGAIGELFLEGPIVGAGYFEDSRSTATAFVEDPPWLLRGSIGIPGRNGRLYRTGDLVKYDHDGSLRFVGRKDAQVKIRGQRVDLGDIEHHIAESLSYKAKPTVVADVFTPRESPSKVLGAFICISNAENMSEAALYTELRKMTNGLEEKLFKVLPIYMIPNVYIPVRSISTSITGKIDRRRLRNIGENLTLEQLSAHDALQTERRQPVSEAEQQLQQLWAAILGISPESIGRDDSFLRLGGDSISAMRLASLARKQGFTITVQDVFEQPKLSDLALAVQQPAKLSEAEHNNIEPFSLLRTKSPSIEIQQQVAQACGVDPCQVEDVFPCTALQEGLLVLTIKRPGDYVARFALELSNMDVGRFQAAWEHTVATTPILRTRMVELGNEGLVQAVLDQGLVWHRESQRLGEYIAADKQQPFGSGTPLTRFALIDSGVQRYFVWTMHHALYDGWSMPRLIDRVDRAYQGETLKLPPPFQAFVKHVANVGDSENERFWKERFAGLATQQFPVLPSGTYQPNADKTVSYTITGLDWPKSNITQSTLIRAAWSILAAQYSGTNDVVFGVTGFGRQVPIPHVDEMIAPTIATVPARVLLNSSHKLQELLNQVQKDAVDTIQFEQTGLQNIRRINCDTEQACQFQTLLTIQPVQQRNRPRGDVANGLNITGSGNSNEKATNIFNTYALHLVCFLGEQEAEIRISYDPHIITSDMAERIPRQLEHVLKQICDVNKTSRSLNEIETISKEDITDVWRWNDTVPQAAESCLHHRIIEIARQQPDAPAICAWDGELTYREFDDLSTALAYHIIGLGVGVGSLVSLCFEKSMWTSVAMLAVMKAGGASSTMDMTQPEERLSTMVRQVQPKVILSSALNKDLSGRLGEQPVIVVDSAHLAQLAGSVRDAPLPCVTPDGLLCVLFTSGSTGAPKGAKLTHRNATSSTKHQWAQLRVDSSTRMFDFASYAFDIAWFNFVYTFSGGACLCVPSEEDRRTNLASSMRALRATYVFLTPSVARLLEPADVPDLKTMALGGEAFVQADKAKWTPHVDYICTYGPAECTFICTIEQAVRSSDDNLRLGWKAGVNTWVININNAAELAPIGAVGELYLEGPLVGTGYLRNAERTAAAYITDPPWLLRGTAERPGRRGRVYRTGDLVRYDPDGGLVFWGRKDAQVKIRGQRMELGDVEHHVTRSLNTTFEKPLVIAEVVQPRESDSQWLIVFIRIEGVESEDQMQEDVKKMTIGVEEKLAKALPIFMLPNAYVPVSTVPMTATGKIDRRRLRTIGGGLSLGQLTALSRMERRPPETETERRLQSLWAKTLRMDPEQIGRDHGFLQLGGDSIAAMRLIVLARQEGLVMTVQDVFKQTRLRDLAAVAQARDAAIVNKTHRSPGKEGGPMIELDDAALHILREADVPTSMVQLATSYQSMCVQGALQTPRQWWVYCYFDLPSGTDIARAHHSCQELWEKMDIVRTAFFFSGSRVLQAVVPPLDAPVTVQQVRGDVEKHFEQVCRLDLQQPAVLGKPFTKFFLIQAAQGPLRLVIRLSHAQYDAVTLGLIARSISASLCRHDPPRFAQFTDFVEHTSLNRDAGIAYWQSLLSGAEMSRINSASCTARDTGSLGEEITIKRIVPLPALRHEITAATTFTAICARALAKVTRKSDLLFARLVSGRAGLGADLQNAAGACLNYVPVRIRIDPATSLGEAERTLQQQFIDTLPYEGVDISWTSSGGPALVWKSGEWGCSVHYENFDGDHAVEMDENRCSIGFSRMLAGSNTHCVKIYARPRGNELCISIDGCSCGRQSLESLLEEVYSRYIAL